jgi:hypothetical protein
MIHKAIGYLVGAATLTMMVLHPGDSSANWKRQPCLMMDTQNDPIPTLQSSTGANCALPNDVWLPADQVASVVANFYYNANVCFAGDVQAKACVVYWGAVGGTCGTTAQNSASNSCRGGVGLSLDASAWTGTSYANEHYVTYHTSAGTAWMFKQLYAGWN